MSLHERPYPGLRPFQMEETHLFFGRETQTDELLERLENRHFLAVVGASGCGKSSLVRAGLLNGLETGFMASAGSRWRFATMLPGNNPIKRLAEALARSESAADGVVLDDDDEDPTAPFIAAALRRGPRSLVEVLKNRDRPEGEQLLLLVDQFEEIFAFRREGGADEADAFVALLLEAAKAGETGEIGVYIVITMRSEFLGNCAVFHGLPEAINQGQFLTPRMNREQLLEAIRGPARVFGGEVEDELLNLMLTRLGPDPDQLPLMQHALARMWTDRTNQGVGDDSIVLTGEGFEAVGGLKAALSEHIEEAYLGLSKRDRELAESLFRGLCERSPDGRDTRRPATLGAIAKAAHASVEDMARVADVFRASTRNFITPGIDKPLDEDTQLDISHESLLRQWDRLGRWLAEEAASAETYRRLAEQASLHAQGKAALWSTPDLELALAWREEARPTREWASRYSKRVFSVTNAEEADAAFDRAMAFLEASEVAEKKRRGRRTRFWVGMGSVGVAGLVVLGFLLAETLRTRAITRATLAAHEAAEEYPEVALWLSLYAFDRDPGDAENRRHVYWAQGEFGLPALYTLPPTASTSIDEGVRDFAFDPEGGRLIAAQGDSLVVWSLPASSAAAGPSSRALQKGATPFNTVATGNGGRAAAGDEAGRFFLGAVDSPPLPQRPGSGDVAHQGAVHAVAIAPDSVGGWAASGGEDGWIRLWSAAGEPVAAVRGHDGAVHSLAFGPELDGRLLLASGGADRRVLLWTVDPLTGGFDGTPVQVGPLNGDLVRALDVERRGQASILLAQGDDQGRVRVWQVTSDTITAFTPPTEVAVGRIRDVALDPSARTLVAGGDDGLARVFTLQLRRPNSPSGQPYQLRDVEAGPHQPQTLRGHRGIITAVAFAPAVDGPIATASLDGTVKLWVSDETRIPPIEKRVLPALAHQGPVRGFAFSPTDDVFATTSNDGLLKLWDYGDPDIGPVLLSDREIPHPDPSFADERRGVSISFAPDGERLAVASLNGGIASIWSVVDTVVGGVTRRALGDTLSTFQPVPGELVGNQNWVWDAEFSPDGTLLGTATGDGHPRIWTADGKTLLSRLPAHEEVSANGGEPTPRFAIDITFSPDFANDSLLATAGRDGAVRVWRWDPGTAEAERVREFRHQRDARSVAFRPAEDGRIRELASGGDDNSVRVWDLETGEQLAELTHGDVVWSVAYSPDGSSLASASYDGLVRVWDLSAGYVDPLEIPVRAQRGAQPARLGRLAFSSRQHVLGVGSWDLRAYLFNLSVEDVAERSWARLTRVLAPYECLQYLGKECGGFFQLRTAAAAHPRAPFAEVGSPGSGGGR